MLSSQGHTQYHGGNKPAHTASKQFRTMHTTCIPRNASEPAFLEHSAKHTLKSYIYRSVDASRVADNKQIHHM